MLRDSRHFDFSLFWKLCKSRSFRFRPPLAMAGFWRQLVFRKKHAINKSKHLNSIIKSSASTQLNSFSIRSRICGPCLISIATNWHLFASIAMIASRILLILGYWSILQPWRAWQDWLWQPQVLLLTLSYFISLCQSFSQLSLSFSYFISLVLLSVKGFLTFTFLFWFIYSSPTLCKRFPHSHFLFLFSKSSPNLLMFYHFHFLFLNH